MYVCVCHGFKESCIEAALETNPTSLGDLYRTLGERPRCGKCVPDMLRLYQDRRPENDTFRSRIGQGTK